MWPNFVTQPVLFALEVATLIVIHALALICLVILHAVLLVLEGMAPPLILYFVFYVIKSVQHALIRVIIANPVDLPILMHPFFSLIQHWDMTHVL